MKLKFPYARLMVYQCLAVDSTKDCYASIINAAHQIGLIGQSNSAFAEQNGVTACGSLMAARQVIEHFLKERAHGNHEALEHVIEELMSQIEENLRKHKVNVESARNCARGACASTCGQYAPIIMDLMLQALTPYA